MIDLGKKRSDVAVCGGRAGIDRAPHPGQPPDEVICILDRLLIRAIADRPRRDRGFRYLYLVERPRTARTANRKLPSFNFLKSFNCF